jgi:MYXO-CTERM domain-containing protein
MKLTLTYVAAALMVTMAAPAMAQNNAADATIAADPYAGQPKDNDDDHGKWGLVGLLGLAGLAGLKRRDRDDHRHTGTTTNDRR